MRPIVLTLLAAALLTQTARPQHRIKQVDDPALLPYQAHIHRILTRQSADGHYAPADLAPIAEKGAYEVVRHWRDDTLSFILIMNDILSAQALTQINRHVWNFWAPRAYDVDGDGLDEIPFTYLVGDTAFLEIADLNSSPYYKRRLDTGSDRNNNGRWDAAVTILDCHDLNGDGYKEVFFNIFSAFDLTPRSIYCLDWKNDSLLWKFDVSGMVTKFHTFQTRDSTEHYFAFGIASQGNSVSTGLFDDQHSYACLLNSRGEVQWTKEMSGVFGWPWMTPVWLPTATGPLLLTITSFGAADQTAPGVGTRLILYDINGREQRRHDLSKDQVMQTFGVWDIDQDENDEIVVATAGKDVLLLSDSLTVIKHYVAPTRLTLWRCEDFFGNGRLQILATTDDGKTLFLNENLTIKCQLDLNAYGGHIFTRLTELSNAGPTLYIPEINSSATYVVSLRKQSIWSIAAAFMTRHQRTVAITMSLLIVALAFTNYHRRKIRKNYDVIARQKKELEESQARLERALKFLEETQARLVQSEKVASLGRLVAGIAHELNNPVGAIRSVQETARRALTKVNETLDANPGVDSSRDDIKKKLAIIEQANQTIGEGSQRVERIVQRLRSFAKLDQAELQRVNIHDGLDEAIELLSHECKNRILITRNYGDVPMLTCHAVHINQAMLNILTNAIEAIRDKGEITVTTLADHENAYIRIRDTGVGIPAEDIGRVFDPGFTAKGVGVGTGLGLAICYQIVTDHHGEIRVESSPGRGSTFTIVLPLKKSN